MSDQSCGAAGLSHLIGSVRMDGLGLFGLSYKVRKAPFLEFRLYGGHKTNLLREHVADSYTETPWLDPWGTARPQKMSDEQEIGANVISVGVVWIHAIGL